jgi:hypothetical protein
LVTGRESSHAGIPRVLSGPGCYVGRDVAAGQICTNDD